MLMVASGLAAVAALAASPPDPARSRKPPEPPLACELLEVRSPQAPRHGSAFQATRVVALEIGARLEGRPTREHQLKLRVYTPQGFLYQVLEPKLQPTAPHGRAFEARLPVAGTSITASGLYGRWKVVPYLDDAQKPCGRSQSFAIRP